MFVYRICVRAAWPAGANDARARVCVYEKSTPPYNCIGIAQYCYIPFCSAAQININDDIGVWESRSYWVVLQTK